MSIAFKPVFVATENSEGRLVFHGKWLLAVLVRLSSIHGEEAGSWFLEAGFGPLDKGAHPTFVTLEAAEAWIAGQVAASDVSAKLRAAPSADPVSPSR